MVKNHDIPVRLSGLIATLSFLLLTAGVFAQQPEYGDDELITFINAAREVMPLQQESQMKMIETIENENLSVERFNMILEAQGRGMEIDITEDEMNSFQVALERIQEIQDEYQDRIYSAIQAVGISPERYQQILADYQQDPELQMRINELMQQMEDEGRM